MTKQCANPGCNKEFTPKKAWGKYCSLTCGNAVRQKRYYSRHKKARAANA
jgi:hypothetical protein